MRMGTVVDEVKSQVFSEYGGSKIYFSYIPLRSVPPVQLPNDQFFRAAHEREMRPSVRTVAPYFDNSLYIDALAKSVETAYKKTKKKPEILVCSTESSSSLLVQGVIHIICHQKNCLLKERLGWDDTKIVTTFQSKFGPEEWLKPYTVEEVARLAKEDERSI